MLGDDVGSNGEQFYTDSARHRAYSVPAERCFIAYGEPVPSGRSAGKSNCRRAALQSKRALYVSRYALVKEKSPITGGARGEGFQVLEQT